MPGSEFNLINHHLRFLLRVMLKGAVKLGLGLKYLLYANSCSNGFYVVLPIDI